MKKFLQCFERAIYEMIPKLDSKNSPFINLLGSIPSDQLQQEAGMEWRD